MENQFGLVLCGGGAKGAYQMGALQALEEDGYLKDLCGVSGVSIGALNALFLCCCGADAGVEVWRKITPATVFDVDLKLIDGKEGIFSRKKMQDLLYEYVDFDTIRSAPYPIYVTIASVEGEKLQVEYSPLNDKSNQDIVTLMEATSALPVIYEDVAFQGVHYRDGGLLDNMPIKPLYDAGCRQFLILSLSTEAKVDVSRYPGAEFYVLKPYKDLGGLLSGTLNFTPEDIAMNLKLGYRDGKRFVKAYLQENEQMLEYYDTYAQMDYDAVMTEIKQDSLQSGIDEKLKYMADMMKKYDV